MADDKFDELIQKQIERENKMKQVREDYIDEMGVKKFYSDYKVIESLKD